MAYTDLVSTRTDADVGNEYAREKASQVLRDAVALLPESDAAAAIEDDHKSDNGTADPEEEPELAAEVSPKRERKPATRRKAVVKIPIIPRKREKRRKRLTRCS